MEEKNGIKPDQYYLDLIASVPKVSVNDERVQEYLSQREGDKDARPPFHFQFGNNFFMFFLGRQRRATKPNDASVTIHLSRAEGLKQWPQFLGENEELLLEIDKAIDGLKPYQELREYQRVLLRERRYDDEDKLDRAANHPLGYEAIGIYLWDKLNPLLEQAAERMGQLGIDARKLYG